MKKLADLKLSNIITATLGILFLIITAMLILLVNQGMKQQALIEAGR